MIDSVLFILKPYIGSITTILLHSLWQGILIGVLTATALAVLRNSSANTRYAVSCLAMAVMIMVVTATAVMVMTDVTGSVAATPQASGEMSGSTGNIETASMAELFGPIIRDSAPGRWWEYLSASHWFFALWFAGVLLLSAYHLMGWYRARGFARRGTNPVSMEWQNRFHTLCDACNVNRLVRLVSSSLVTVPCVVGWVKPVILVPVSMLTSLDSEEIEMILIHELAHVRRYDVLVNILQTAVESLLFFNPAIWWLSRQIRIEREHCCDDRAVSLTGDNLKYARALANLEELRMHKTIFSTAIAGTPLASRIKRIVGLSKPRLSSSGLSLPGIVLLVSLIALSLGSLGGSQDAIVKAETSIETSSEFKPAGADWGGEWDLESKRDKTQIVLHHRRYSSSRLTFDSDELIEDIGTGQQTFQIVRDAGTLFFEGEIELRGKQLRGQGEWYFEPKREYARTMRRYGVDSDDDEKLLSLTIFDISPDFIADLEDLGYNRLDAGDFLSARIHGVTPKLIKLYRNQGYDDLDFDDLVAMQIHGVTPDWGDEFARLGFRNLSVDDLVAAKIHGVTPELIEQYQDDGFRELDFDDFIAMRIHGVTPDLGDEFSRLGFRNLSADDLVAARIHGVTPELIEQYQDDGYDDLDFDDFIAMRIHGVTPDMENEFSRLGFRNLSADDLVAARIHGVTPRLIKQYQDDGYDDLDFDDFIAMRIHGVTPDTKDRFEALGFRNLSADDLVAARIHGVTPDFIDEFRDAGFRDLSFDSFIALRIFDLEPDDLEACSRQEFTGLSEDNMISVCVKDITPEDVEDMREAGFADEDINSIVEMLAHDVTPRYVRAISDLGYDDLSPELLIEMRDHNITPSFVRRLQRQGMDDLTARDLVNYKEGRR